MPIEPGAEELERFRQGDQRRSLVMVQLLRFHPGGLEKYVQYSAAAQPILTRLGAQVLYAGQCAEPLLRGGEEPWDAILLVRYPSRAAYLELLADPAYQKSVHLRREAVREAMMLPMDDWPGR